MSSTRDLVDLVDRRIRQVQQKVNTVPRQTSTVFHATLSTALMPSLSALQTYVDEWLLDQTFPWQRHWFPHLLEHNGGDEGAAATSGSKGDPVSSSPTTGRGVPPAATTSSDETERSAAAVERRINAFVDRAEAALASGAASGKGTIRELEVCVLYHVTLLLQKLLRPPPASATAGASSDSGRQGEAAGASVAPGETTAAAVQLRPAAAAAAAATSSPAGAATKETQGATRMDSVPPPSATGAAGPSPIVVPPEALSTVLVDAADEGLAALPAADAPAATAVPGTRVVTAGGVEVAHVNMAIANRVCRPSSARSLGAKKELDGRVQRSVGEMVQGAARLTSREADRAAAETSPRRRRPNTANTTAAASATAAQPAAAADGADEAHHHQHRDDEALLAERAAPSIRKPSAPVLPMRGQTARARLGQHASIQLGQKADGARMLQEPVSAVVYTGSEGASTAKPANPSDASPRREAAGASSSGTGATPRRTAVTLPTRQWGVRMTAEQRQLMTRAGRSRWVLMSSDMSTANNGAGGGPGASGSTSGQEASVARATQTVCVTSSVLQRQPEKKHVVTPRRAEDHHDAASSIRRPVSTHSVTGRPGSSTRDATDGGVALWTAPLMTSESPLPYSAVAADEHPSVAASPDV